MSCEIYNLFSISVVINNLIKAVSRDTLATNANFKPIRFQHARLPDLDIIICFWCASFQHLVANCGWWRTHPGTYTQFAHRHTCHCSRAQYGQFVRQTCPARFILELHQMEGRLMVRPFRAIRCHICRIFLCDHQSLRPSNNRWTLSDIYGLSVSVG